MRVTRGAAALVVLALVTTGAGCTDTAQQSVDAPESAIGAGGAVPGGIDTVDWPDDSEGAAALFAELPDQLDGAGQIDFMDASEGDDWYVASYYDHSEEADESSQWAGVTASLPSFSDDPEVNRMMAMAWAVLNAGGPGGCVGLHHSPEFSELCSEAAAVSPDAADGTTALDAAFLRLEAMQDPGGLLWIEFTGGPIDEDGTWSQEANTVLWSDDEWQYAASATTPELRTALVEAMVNAARQA